MTPWTLPGYDVTGRLGSRRELWRAVDLATGEVCVLRRVDVAASAEVARMSAVVATLRSEHLVRLRRTVSTPDGEVLVLDHAEHGGLADLMRRRDRLTAGEVVTVIAPLAAAVAEAHARGLMHGRIDASTVLIGRGGRPLLDGLGLGALHAGPATAGPDADVRALADLATDLLDGDASAEADRVRSALTAMTAAELAEAVLAACAAVAIQGLTAAPPPAVAGGSVTGGHRFRRTGAVVVVLGLVAGGAVVRGQRAPATDWQEVVVALDAARARAFTAADARLLAEVYVAGSPAAVADQARLAALGKLGRRASGVQHEVDEVTAVQVSAERAELRVSEQLQAHQVTEADGRVVARIPPGERRTDLLVLAQTAEGWRIAAVR
jgi:hypothetical protein